MTDNDIPSMHEKSHASAVEKGKSKQAKRNAMERERKSRKRKAGLELSKSSGEDDEIDDAAGEEGKERKSNGEAGGVGNGEEEDVDEVIEGSREDDELAIPVQVEAKVQTDDMGTLEEHDAGQEIAAGSEKEAQRSPPRRT